MSEGTATTLTVLQSYRAPKPTTNPYITQLHRSLSARADTRILPFRHRTAIWGRYDIVHLHWPELIMGGHKWSGRAMRRTLAALAILRWTLTRVPVIRTVHNLERPTNIGRIDQFLLDRIDRLTRFDIRLNEHTPPRPGIEGTTIPHGHYRDWFADTPKADAVTGRIGYVGLIRRYKGVEDLIAAFVAWPDPSVSLHVAGKPSTPELVDLLAATAGADARVSIEPRFLDEPELVRAITSAELIVLPYRHMHNSGTALAALSLARPVLVPDNDVNRALADEVGDGWVQTFTDALDAAALERALASARSLSAAPNLSSREWGAGAEAHAAVYRHLAKRR